MQRSTPPFRADHVGSLLRPPALKEARAKYERQEISADALRAVEDREIERRSKSRRRSGSSSPPTASFAARGGISTSFAASTA